MMMSGVCLCVSVSVCVCMSVCFHVHAQAIALVCDSSCSGFFNTLARLHGKVAADAKMSRALAAEVLARKKAEAKAKEEEEERMGVEA